MSQPESNYLYFAVREISRRYDVKIGITNDPKRRMKQIKGDLIFAVPCTTPTAVELEKACQKTFEPWRLEGSEWFTSSASLWKLITGVLHLGYWPWDRTPIVRGENW